MFRVFLRFATKFLVRQFLGFIGLCCGSDRFVSLSLQNSKPAALPKTPCNLIFNALSLGMKVRGATKMVSLACFDMRSIGSIE